MKGGISPDSIKRILFSMILRGILRLSYDRVENRAVLSLAHFVIPNGTLSFTLYDDEYWEGMDLK